MASSMAWPKWMASESCPVSWNLFLLWKNSGSLFIPEISLVIAMLGWALILSYLEACSHEFWEVFMYSFLENFLLSIFCPLSKSYGGRWKTLSLMSAFLFLSLYWPSAWRLILSLFLWWDAYGNEDLWWSSLLVPSWIASLCLFSGTI